MVTKSVNKAYCKEIAKIFCKADSLCVNSVKVRLINNLTDSSFENHFLPNLDQGRFYVHHFSNFIDHGGGNISVDSTFYDLITNVRTAGRWDFKITPGENAFNSFVWLLSKYGFNVIQGFLPYTYKTHTLVRIVHKPSKQPGYGIMFVPGSAIGSTGGTGTGAGQVTTTQTEPVPTIEPDPANDNVFDLKKILPALITGIAIYFLTG